MTFRVRSMLLANRVVGIVLPTWATDTLDIVVPTLAHTRSTLLSKGGRIYYTIHGILYYSL